MDYEDLEPYEEYDEGEEWRYTRQSMAEDDDLTVDERMHLLVKSYCTSYRNAV